MKGELYINGQDAWTKWGIQMDDASLSALMTPPGVKDYPKNQSRLEDGTRYITHSTKLKERDLTLSLQFVANNKEEFYAHYTAFCNNVLAHGTINIKTKYQADVVYKCIYQSCTQYRQFLGKVAKFSLKLVESDPSDRSTNEQEQPIS